ncbi:MAG: hypothetical protein IT562_14960 [Alphaproteobacteria bacterium]|nr:hypothetical protein [Alphaproteobacteria bacterium]
MMRLALSAALLLATFGTAMAAAPPEATNSATASQLALAIRACNEIADPGQRDACKKDAWDQRSYGVHAPLRAPGRFDRTYN